MRTSILLACVFFMLFVMENAFLHAFTGSIASMPLMVIAGMIILQRVGIEEGAAWFLALAVFRADGVALLLSLIGPFLILQIFTTRSVYALLGFGAVAYTLSSVIFILFGEFFDFIFSTTLLVAHPIRFAFIEGALLLPGLLVGVIMLRSIERRILTQFSFKSLS